MSLHCDKCDKKIVLATTFIEIRETEKIIEPNSRLTRCKVLEEVIICQECWEK